MKIGFLAILLSIPRGWLIQPAALDAEPSMIGVDWSAPPVVSTEGVPTYLNQVNPSMDRESPIHDAVFKQMCALGTNLVRYLHWSWSGAPFPELIEGTFNFTLMDQYVLDFMQCPNAQNSVINFDMWGGPDWLHINGDRTGPLRDPSGVEYGQWVSRIVSWYTKGGFTDQRTGKVYKSGHNFNWTNYEVLNEPDGQPYMSTFVNKTGGLLPPWAAYTLLYDGIAGVLHHEHPELKLHALSLAGCGDDRWLSYFFDKANHLADAPIPTYVTYHYYAYPGEPLGNGPGDWPTDAHGAGKHLPVEQWPIHMFKQAAGFVAMAEHANSVIRKGSFGGDAKISVNEVGVIGGEFCPTSTLFTSSKQFWNLKAALWGFYYGELLRLGTSSVASSQITGYPANTWTIHGSGVTENYPCVSMIDWHDGSGTAVYWAVKMFADVLGAGNKSVFTTTSGNAVNCENPFPFRAPGDICYNNADDAKKGEGPCGSWCTMVPGGSGTDLGCPQPPSRLCSWVPPYWPLPSVVYSIGIKLHARNARALLLTNTNISQAIVQVSGGMGSQMHVVDTEAGHGPVPYATKVLGSNEVRLGPLAVALIVIKDEHPQTTLVI